MESQIRLRWTSHQGTILSIFDALLSSESLVDVTLACEGQYLRCHRVILSACSPYFQELLNIEAHKHPILFLKDVKYTELKALIQYMYRGEVNIAQEELPSLLVVAQALKIRGLAEVETSNNTIASDTIILPDLNKSKVLNKPSPMVPTSSPIPMATTSSNLHVTRSFSQAHSFSSNINANITPSIPTASSSNAPPPPKKSRTENSRLSQNVQIQKQSQMIDPLLNIQSSVILPPQPTQMFDPLQTTPNASGHYDAIGHEEQQDFGNEGMIEQPEPMYTAEDVKVEHITGGVEVDLEEEEENSMSQSSFSDTWKMGDGDNSGMAEDDGEIPGGSGVGANNESGVQGAEGGEGTADDAKGYTCLKCMRIYTSSKSLWRHRKYTAKCTDEKTKSKAKCTVCTKLFSRTDNLKRHYLIAHSM